MTDTSLFAAVDDFLASDALALRRYIEKFGVTSPTATLPLYTSSKAVGPD